MTRVLSTGYLRITNLYFSWSEAWEDTLEDKTEASDARHISMVQLCHHRQAKAPPGPVVIRPRIRGHAMHRLNRHSAWIASVASNLTSATKRRHAVFGGVD